MEREQLQKLFKAIKSDDLKSFTSLMLSKSDLNISFGRFPILSLCYLYKSEKILNKFEKNLAPINKFEVVPEYFEIYKDFKRQAKKSLRIFACREIIVYPILMLSILDERELIKNKYKILFKNEEILENLYKIYKLNQQIEIIATKEKFECKAKKLSFAKKLFASALVVLFCAFSVFSFISISVIKNTFGLGTESLPIYISNENEFITALQKGNKYYVLENDIILSEQISVENFSGTIDGSDHTIYLPQNLSGAILKNSTGTIKNVNFEFETNDMKFASNYAILTNINAGIIDNCSFIGKISGIISGSGDLFVTAVAVENKGTISNTIVNLEAGLTNEGQTNAYLSAFAGKNYGMILNSNTTANKFISDTVDLSGVAGENYGTISNVSNNIELVQTSSKEWHPNCAGIAMTNYGTIENATNNANISSESTATKVPEGGELHVYSAGISCNNYKIINSSKNQGDISGKGKVSVSFVGGIVALNVVDNNFSVNEQNILICEVKNSNSICKINSFSDEARVYAGGIVAVNNTQVTKCGFEGSISCDTNYNNTENFNVYAGGIVGFNNECVLRNCYANVRFENVPEEQENIVKVYGAVAGYIGFAKTYYQMFGQVMMGSAYNYVSNNHFVENETTKYVAYGQVMMVDLTTSNYSFEKISADSYYFVKHTSVDTIPSEVKGNE